MRQITPCTRQRLPEGTPSCSPEGPYQNSGPRHRHAASLNRGEPPAPLLPRERPYTDNLVNMPESVARQRAVKAVIPAAGLATRFLPATKAVPKELLPVVDRPVLQYIVEEAAAAGITDVLLITGRGKTSMVDHFDRRPDLESRLAEKGDEERLAPVLRTSELADIYPCRQGEPLGLGHAVGVGESHIAGEAFAVLLGDEFVAESDPLLPAMLDLQAQTGGNALAFLRGAPAGGSRHGVASIAPAPSPSPPGPAAVAPPRR